MKTVNIYHSEIVGINHRNDLLIDLTLANGKVIKGEVPNYEMGMQYSYSDTPINQAPIPTPPLDVEVIDKAEDLEDIVIIDRFTLNFTQGFIHEPGAIPQRLIMDSEFTKEKYIEFYQDIADNPDKYTAKVSDFNQLANKPEPGEDKTTQINNTMRNVKEITLGKWEQMLAKLGLFSYATKEKMEQAKAEAKRLFTKETDQEKEQFINDNLDEVYAENEVVEIVAFATTFGLGSGISWALGLWLAVKVSTWAAIKGVGSFGVLVIIYGIYFAIGCGGTALSLIGSNKVGRKARTKYSRYQLAKIYMAGKKAEAEANIASK